MEVSSSVSGIIFLILLFTVPLASCDELSIDSFLQCLSNHTNPSSPIADNIYTPKNSSFQATLEAYAKNLRFLTFTTLKPLAIIAPKDESHVQATVICAKSNGLQIRIRSGGHDYEGLSYISQVPFLILDMFNFRSIKIDSSLRKATVQAGAIVGELYYQIGQSGKDLAFPAGTCPTVGIGGHFSGGGYGNLVRKFGLSADNIIDAKIVNANGEILDRKSMGEDLFWSIRGGGGASFGVVLEWTIGLVQVPEIVTVFKIIKSLKQGGTDIVYRWQQIASDVDSDLFIRVIPNVVNGSNVGEQTIEFHFYGMFLGQADKLLPLMNESFPELGLQRQDCKEMSWIESTLFFAGFPNGTSIDVLLERSSQKIYFFKMKSDYVKNVIPKSFLEEIWKLMIKLELKEVQFSPYGGIMNEISETSIPLPQRAGYRFKIHYTSAWEDGIETEKQVNFSRQMYEAMTAYVTSNPREAYPSFRDVDIGSNPSNFTDFNQGQVYGHKYFKDNFERLTKVKATVDPDNFFKHEQSIPPLLSS